ncbi:prostasin isoform X2 [Theropithecus gelada]|uniref:prostasin isoform X2 n=1 Tax=Theropithecus gelada TaxID=9565 RepID=UPI000DC1ACED|nr:prostasin isoform X2 [Theropithecus gelada]
MVQNGVLGPGQLGAVAILLYLGLFRSGTGAEGTEAPCGVAPQARITGGSNAVPGQWPWQVSTVEYIIPHPSYLQEGSQGDIALLQLSSPVTFSRYIRPICLPAANASFPNGLHCTVTGWGHVAPSVSLLAPKPLQQLEVPLISRETCNCLYNINAKPEEPHFVQEDMVCAGYVEGGKDACQGDSGGPLSCPVEGLWYLTGIVSWGDACGARNRPGVYTLASSYASWIQSKATELQPRVVPQSQESQPDSNLCSSHLAFNSAPAQGLLRPILFLPLGLALGLLSPWLSEH